MTERTFGEDIKALARDAAPRTDPTLARVAEDRSRIASSKGTAMDRLAAFQASQRQEQAPKVSGLSAVADRLGSQYGLRDDGPSAEGARSAVGPQQRDRSNEIS